MLVFFDNEINLFVFRVDLGGCYMIPVDWDEILSRFAEIPEVLKILHKLYLAITCKRFHLGKAGSLLCTAGIPCNRFSPPKWDEKVNQHISLKKSI